MVEQVVLLDTGIVGLITNPSKSEEGEACNRWMQQLLQSGVRIIVPEIADYELRRELLRAGKYAGVRRLDTLNQLLEYQPINTEIMRQAAVLWAQVRQIGQPTADRHALDGDVILAAQAMAFGEQETVVATTNVKHLSRFTAAKLWTEIN